MRYSIFILLILSCGFAIGQRKKNLQDTSVYLQQPHRIEFEISANDFGFQVINGGKNGLLVIKKSNVRNENGYGWVMYKLDTTLQIEWAKLLIVPYTSSFIGFDYSKGNYYLLFTKEEFKPAELLIYTVDHTEGNISISEITTVFPLLLSHFEVMDNVVLLAGTTNYRPAVVTFNMNDRTPRVIPGIYADNVEIADITIDDKKELFSVVTTERMVNKRFTTSVKTYTTDNLLLLSSYVEPGERKTLIDGAATSFSNGFQYVAGAYSNKNVLYSRGLYLGKFANGKQQFIKYYNYAELSNFFGYLKPNRQDRINNRIEKKKDKGKNSKFNYKLQIHEMIERGDEIILVAEAYYPRYSNYTTIMGPAAYGYGSMMDNRNRSYYNNIVGYRYTHAVVVAFDKNGQIKWDQSFPLDNVFSSTLKKYITVNATDNSIELLYLDKNMIKSKIISGNKIIEGKTYNAIRLASDKDQNKNDDPDVEGMERWYNDVMYAFGEQKIEHTINNKLKANRNVFYINKLRYNLDEFQN